MTAGLWGSNIIYKILNFFSKNETGPDQRNPNNQQDNSVPAERKGSSLPTFKQTEIPGVSIQQMEDDAKKKKQEEERVAQLAHEENDFSTEELTTAWRQYAQSVPSEKILLQTTLISCVSSLKLYNNWEIEAIVDTPHQIDELEKEKVDLLTHLSQTLKNGKIQLVFRISDNGENKNSMTLQDLFNDVLKRNSAFAQLSSFLGLEVE